MNRVSVVYFLELQAPSLPIKVGVSAFLDKRVGQMSGYPWDVVLMGTVEGDRVLEQAIHRRFAHLRMRGEWFKRNTDILLYIHDKTGYMPRELMV